MKITKNIIIILIISSFAGCQYKAPGPWYMQLGHNILQPDWRHQFNSRYSSCDDAKLEFIDKYIHNYHDVDTAFLADDCWIVSEKVKQDFLENYNNPTRIKIIELLKQEGYKIEENYKQVSKYDNKKKAYHYIVISSTSKNDKNRSIGHHFQWEYDYDNEKWILKWCFAVDRGAGY